jgi:hypothetical protein
MSEKLKQKLKEMERNTTFRSHPRSWLSEGAISKSSLSQIARMVLSYVGTEKLGGLTQNLL